MKPIALALAAGAAALLWTSPAAALPADRPDPEVTRHTVHAFYDAINAMDPGRLAPVLSEDFVDHTPDPGQPPGRDGFLAIITAMDKVFPDIAIKVEDVVVEGDRAIARVNVSATQKAPFFGHPSYGKHFAVSGYDQFRVVNGKVVERWGLWDSASMLHQLGLDRPASK